MRKLTHSKGRDFAINLIGVTKQYVIHHEKPTLVEKFFRGKDEKFLALRNINFKVKKGDSVGIVGENGSGKTTLLKIMAGIATPTQGTVHVAGRVISLIDLNAGFHEDLSGFQNIYLNAMFLGMTKKEINKEMGDIISLAGIRQFIDAPFFTYSQGMKLRLGFSVAVHSNPDILLLDENIAVGDEEFAKISYSKVQEIIRQGKTLIVASHNLEFINENCKRAIWIDKGKIKMDSDVKKVTSSYYRSSI